MLRGGLCSHAVVNVPTVERRALTIQDGCCAPEEEEEEEDARGRLQRWSGRRQLASAAN